MGNSSTFIRDLKHLQACSEAVGWASQYDSLDDAWAACERGDWMLWLVGYAAKSECDRKKLTLAACECARHTLPHVLEDEERPLRAIEMAEAWARGKADGAISDVQAANIANAYAAADAATNASAATNAANAVASVYVAYTSADTNAEAYAATDAARKRMYKKCANIVRNHYPTPPTL